jgi:branched-chain amino acid transport system ATP-binding protein
VLEAIAFVGLDGDPDERVGTLGARERRMVEIARAVVGEPKVVLLDEPAAGMNPQETTELLGFIRGIHQRYGLTLVVVEHDMSLIMRLCDRIQVLNYGQTLCEGNPEQVRANPMVIEAYLGTRSRERRGGHDAA